MDAPDAVLAGRYRLVNRLAAGGMGSVWEAWDELLQRPVAVKQLLYQPGLSKEDAQVAVDRAMREARITARLHHPHAVPVYDVVEHEGRPCLIMQYVPSQSLQEILNEKGALAPTVVAGIGADIASALAAAHQAGIVHRDVKPSNVLITEDGSAKLTDFGVSHAVGDVTLTSVGMVTGTPAYLAPEVARGARSDAAADVFSLGATLYAALEGSPPFGTAENPMALLHRVASGQTVPPRRSGPLAPLLVRMLAANPADRPPMIDVSRTLTALRADLDSMQEPTRPMVPPIPVPVPAEPWSTNQPVTGLGAAPTATLPPVEPVGPVGPPAGPPLRPPAGREPGSNRALVVLIAAAVLIGLGIAAALLLMNQDGGGSPANPPGVSATHSSVRPPTTSAASQPASSTATSTTEQSTPESSSPTASQGQQSTPTDAQLAQAITDYYALLPANTDAAWNRLTRSYQHGTARNRKYYDSFWGSIDRVETADVSGTAPDSAQASLTYTYRDGRVVRERTAFRLVPEDGILKIDSSTVLSSQTQ
ncbi:MAG: serine/threonine-protein kinase [Jatrophihabitantaceae bacterium]